MHHSVSLNPEIKDQISLFLNIYEQQRKVEAKRVKEARSRAAINGVNSRTQEQLQELNNIADEEQAADSAKKFEAAIEGSIRRRFCRNSSSTVCTTLIILTPQLNENISFAG